MFIFQVMLTSEQYKCSRLRTTVAWI